MTTASPASRLAPADHPIHPLIQARWSPRGFDARPLADGELHSLLEAARWTPSSYNEQPWRFVIGSRTDEAVFGALLGCLNPNNRLWAERASALLVAVAKNDLTSNGAPNRTAAYDVGQAVAMLSVQATALGLAVHQMVGFDAEAVRERFRIPDGFTPMTAVAIGHAGDASHLPDTMRQKEIAPRTRKSLGELVYGDTWAAPYWR